MPFVRINGEVVEVGNDALFTDPNAQSPLNIPTGQIFTADDIERARQQEKDKLYGRIGELTEQITGLTEQVGGLTAEQQREKAAAEQERQRLEAEARRQEEEGLDARELIARKEQEWQQSLAETRQSLESRLEEERQAREQAEAIAAKERTFNDLREYIAAQIAANQQNIAPELISWVGGNSREEVDANVARAIETTNTLTANFQSQLEQFTQQQDPNAQVLVPAGAPQPPAQPGVTPYGGPANFDPAGQQSQTLTKDDIERMDMNQYAQLRRTMGIGGQSNARGLFG